MRMMLTATAALLLFAGETCGASLSTFASVEFEGGVEGCNLGSTYGSGSASWNTGFCFLTPDPTSSEIFGSASGNATYGSVAVGVLPGADHFEPLLSAHAAAAFSDELTFSDPAATFLQLFYDYSIQRGLSVVPADSALNVEV